MKFLRKVHLPEWQAAHPCHRLIKMPLEDEDYASTEYYLVDKCPLCPDHIEGAKA